MAVSWHCWPLRAVSRYDILWFVGLWGQYPEFAGLWGRYPEFVGLWGRYPDTIFYDLLAFEGSILNLPAFEGDILTLLAFEGAIQIRYFMICWPLRAVSWTCWPLRTVSRYDILEFVSLWGRYPEFFWSMMAVSWYAISFWALAFNGGILSLLACIQNWHLLFMCWPITAVSWYDMLV